MYCFYKSKHFPGVESRSKFTNQGLIRIFFSHLVTSNADKHNIFVPKQTFVPEQITFSFIEQSFQNAPSLTDGHKMEKVRVLSSLRSDCIQWAKYRMDIFLQFM